MSFLPPGPPPPPEPPADMTGWEMEMIGDPVADLIARAAFYNDLVRFLIVLAAAVALIFVVGP